MMKTERDDEKPEACRARLWLWLFLIFAISCPQLSSKSLSLQNAYEKVITPHWIQKIPSAQKRFRVLFIVNARAQREVQELSQRFDIDAITLNTMRGSNAYKNIFDLTQFKDIMDDGDGPDAIVMAAKKTWQDLGEEACARVITYLERGGKVMVLGRSSPMNVFKDMGLDEQQSSWLTSEPHREKWSTSSDLYKEDLPMHVLFSKKKPLSMTIIPWRTKEQTDDDNMVQKAASSGRLCVVSPYDTHFTYFNAFIPKRIQGHLFGVEPELSYLIIHRLIKNMCDDSLEKEHNIRWAWSDPFGNAFDYDLKIPVSAKKVIWSWRSPWGQELQRGSNTCGDSTNSIVPLQSKLKHACEQVLVWRALDRDGKLCKTGLYHYSGSPWNLQLTSPKVVNLEPKASLSVSWKSEGQCSGGEVVHLQVYDPDQHLWKHATSPNERSQLSVEAWPGSFVSYEGRLLLSRGDVMLAEERFTINRRLNTSKDLSTWQTIVWGDEQGYLAERWRYKSLRSLGMSTIATIGTSMDQSLLASKRGMRVLPTNVFVPKNRFNMKKFSESKAKEEFSDLLNGLKGISPLAYSLADEPPAKTGVKWLKTATSLAEDIDPSARLGFCGFWVKEQTTDWIANSRFSTPYSPVHLYNSNLWLGVERDLYRSIKQDDMLLTYWTHYVPWLNHRPYSKSAPWVWLFDGAHGISYFNSIGSFGILEANLTPSHESRWFRSELREISSGLGEQVMAMKAAPIEVAILFKTSLDQSQAYGRWFNRQHIPYKFIDLKKMKSKDLEDVKLLLLGDANALDSESWALLRQATTRGTVIFAANAIGLNKPLGQEERSSFEACFGFTPQSLDKKLSKGTQAVVVQASYDGIQMQGKSFVGFEHDSSARDTLVTPLSHIGQLDLSRDGGSKTLPEPLQLLSKTPAFISSRQGKSVFSNLALNDESVGKLMLLLCERASLSASFVDVDWRDKGSATSQKPPVYLKSLMLHGGDHADGMVALIPDHERIAATEKCDENPDAALPSYDSLVHGALKWPSLPCELQFKTKSYVYNTRTGSFLGHLDRLDCDVKAGDVMVWTCLQEKPKPIQVDLGDNLRQSEPLTLKWNAGYSEKLSHGGQRLYHISITDTYGRILLEKNIKSPDLDVSCELSLPQGLDLQQIQISLRDVLTGRSVQVQRPLTRPRQVAFAPLQPWAFETEWVETKRPQAVWKKVQSTSSNQKLMAQVEPLTSFKAFYGPHNGYQHLKSQIKLNNQHREYIFKYLVCNDVAKTKSKDRVIGIRGSGLGLTKPKPHLWHYQGYINVLLDEQSIFNRAIDRIENLSDKQVAHVKITWLDPKHTTELHLMMTPDHEGIFHQLKIIPRKTLGTVQMSTKSYPEGFGKKKGKAFFEKAQEHQEWVLFGDRARDLAFYPDGGGCGGMLIEPEQWDIVKYGKTSKLSKAFSEASSSQGTKERVFRWVMWIFPERSNADALQYMRRHSEDYTQTNRALGERIK